MRLLLGEWSPRVGAPAENIARIDAVLARSTADLAIFPELYASGYRAGDRLHGLALRPGANGFTELSRIATARTCGILLGAPIVVPERPGETYNAVALFGPDGTSGYQVKRYLPTYGPFEEGRYFTPGSRSEIFHLGAHAIGLAICYDAFFPEIFRGLSEAGAELLVIVSASPVTSRRLFEKILPARAVENACPVVYVNRVGVEDGIVFGGGSGAWDVRGEPISFERQAVPGGEAEEGTLLGTIDLDEARRWRPFRPVLRDVTARPVGGPAVR